MNLIIFVLDVMVHTGPSFTPAIPNPSSAAEGYDALKDQLRRRYMQIVEVCYMHAK